MMKKFAFFDVDGTVYNGFTINDFIDTYGEKWAIAEKEHIFNSYNEGKISYSKGSKMIHDVLGKLFKDQETKNVDDIAQSFLKTNRNKIYLWVKPLIKYLKDRKFEIVFVSSSIKPIVKVIADKLGADRIFTTDMEVTNDNYTGVTKRILNSENKEKTISDYLSNQHEDYYLIGIGDSSGDIGMLSMMDKAYVVNLHQEKMKKIAGKMGWHVLDKEDVYENLRKSLSTD